MNPISWSYKLVVLKKVFAISFLFIYLFTTTELSQLLKVPLLVEHFIEHREDNRHISLWQFLCIHYAKGEVRDADYDRDMQLPFKTHDYTLSVISNTYAPLFESVSIQLTKQIVEKKIFAIKDEVLLTSFLSNIWQPPRVS